MSSAVAEAVAPGDDPPPLSKNKLKKLKRDEKWEAGREARKAKRKEKAKAKKARLRAAREEANLTGTIESSPQPKHSAVQIPVTFLIDCSFNYLMTDKDFKSLASQITRSYSENQKAPCRANIAVCSFGGDLRERFEGPLGGHYRSWKYFDFLEQDFLATWKAKVIGDEDGSEDAKVQNDRSAAATSVEKQESGNIIYLTGDSSETLSELRPHDTYIIGGLVDRNRHKGICYKIASDKGLRTAKLPIGEYMKMSSRFVLTVNQVVEIMLRWLEYRDWGRAFIEVIPKRKGGTLKRAMVDDENEANDERGYEALSDEASQTCPTSTSTESKSHFELDSRDEKV